MPGVWRMCECGRRLRSMLRVFIAMGSNEAVGDRSDARRWRCTAGDSVLHERVKAALS